MDYPSNINIKLALPTSPLDSFMPLNSIEKASIKDLVSLIKLIKEVASTRAGPPARFLKEHALLALLTLSNSPLGRKSLAQRLGLGEGSVRSLLKKLEAKNLLTSTRAGCQITEEGGRFVKIAQSVLVGPMRVRAGDLTVGAKDAAVLVRGGGAFVDSGLGVRDSAFRAGADGATVLVVREDGVYFPDGIKCPGELQEIATNVAGLLNAREGDAVVIGTAQTYTLAEVGAIAGALWIVERAIRGR